MRARSRNESFATTAGASYEGSTKGKSFTVTRNFVRFADLRDITQIRERRDCLYYWRDDGNDFHGNAAIVVWTGRDVLTIPSTALFRLGRELGCLRGA